MLEKDLLNCCNQEQPDIKKIRTLISNGANINARDEDENTPLILLTSAGSVEGVDFLISHGADPLLINRDGWDALATAIENEHKVLIKKLVIACAKHRRFIEVSDQDTDQGIIYKLMTTLIYENSRHPWGSDPCYSLRRYLTLLNPKYKNFKKNDFVQEIEAAETKNNTFYGSYLSDDSDSEEEDKFEKRPNDGKNISIKNANILRSRAQISSLMFKNKARGNKKGELKIKAFDASAVFEFSERQKIYRSPILDANKAQIENDLEKLNKLISEKDKFSGDEFQVEMAKIQTKFMVAQYRGITYLTTKWNKTGRKDHRDSSEINQPVYSYSVYQAAGVRNLSELTKKKEEIEDFNEVVKKIGELVKNILLSFRESDSCGYNGYAFNNLAELLQQAYTMDYHGFHALISTDPNLKDLLLNHANPFISTGDTPYHALKYAFGMKPYEGHEWERLRPRWQKNGRAERPYSGKVYLSLHPIQDYIENGPLHLVSLVWQGRVQLDNLIVAERETTFPGYIPENRVKYHFKAKYPSFKSGKYKKIYEYKYGIKEEEFEKLREYLKNSAPHTQENKNFKKFLGEWLCSYHEVKMIDKARQIAEIEHGAVLIYRDKNGLFSLKAPVDSPTRNGVPENLKSPVKINRALRKQISPPKNTGIQDIKIDCDLDQLNDKVANDFRKRERSKKYSPSFFGERAVFNAFEECQVDILSHFLSKQNIVSYCNQLIFDQEQYPEMDTIEKASVVHMAVVRGNIDILNVLLNCNQIEVNFCVNELTDENWHEDYVFYENIMPLHLAIMQKSHAMVELLLSCPRVNKDASLWSVHNKDLLKAAGPRDSSEELNVDKEKDVGCLGYTWERDDFMQVTRTKDVSSLHLAVKFADIKMLELLLNAGLDLFQKNSEGKSAYDIAVENKKNDVAAFIKEKESLILSGYVNALNISETSSASSETLKNTDYLKRHGFNFKANQQQVPRPNTQNTSKSEQRVGMYKN